MTVTAEQLLELPTHVLLKHASVVRDTQHGSHITYSPKVFIPLTKLCRDKCGYCTFAQPPARVDDLYLSPDEVLAIAQRGVALGCSEALFTLGERPELRYPQAMSWLNDRGYDSTVAYLRDMCALVRDETGLLPHANAGALNKDELASLRSVSASQGMMLESLNESLRCHVGSPDKVPERRLLTLEAAGEIRIPFTTGLLIGIGETEVDRLAALEAIATSHRMFGHVQEVIVQNFLPKAGTSMHLAKPCSAEEHMRAVALARLVLPNEVHVQAPPNLSADFASLIDAGIDDWGGVSTVTPDHVNPEKPWPEIEVLHDATESKGFRLQKRLTVYPEFLADAETWIADEMLPAVKVHEALQ